MAPDVLDFGNVDINTVATATVTLTGCNAPINGISFALGGSDASLFTVDDFPIGLLAGQSATVRY